ncbi:response regulator [Halovivax gelatinilyticus]|uniref:response regulator n=1 Tax=Halovivax gelatinilyticus TaxID=2961597 RepID=UPI0020CA82A9|nr:response regulator [Halovivax gelatinilyticus]
MNRYSNERATILLVEDNPGDVRLTREALAEGEIDASLDVVTDGVSALEYLRQRGEYADVEPPALVLLDLNLPRKSGDEVLAEIREDPDRSRLPVIVLTSSNADEDVARSYDLSANAYLTKPIDADHFVEAIRAMERFWLRDVHLPPE